MNKKSGFTLVELMAVIAILAVIIIIAMPNVIVIYNESRREAFLNEVRNMINASEQFYVTESTKGNWIEDVGSNDSFETYVPDNRNYKTLVMDGEDGFEFYGQLDEDGHITRFVAVNNDYSIFTVNGKEDITIGEVVFKYTEIENYIEDFNIDAPTILSKDAYSKEYLQFDFNAKDLKEQAESGATYTTWTSNDGSVTGTLYKVSNGGSTLSKTLGNFDGNAIVFPGWQGFRFDASFDFDDTGGEDGYGSFTLESTINLSDFETVKNHPYVNVISNIESGGYYLNVYHLYTDTGVYGWPGLSVWLNGGYRHCTSKTPIRLNEDYVIAGSFNRNGNITKVYINGEQVKVNGDEWSCDYNNSWALKYPAMSGGKKVPLSVGGNPSHKGFTNVEWVYGKVYTARIYKGVLDAEKLKSNYYSNMVLVNDYDEKSQIITLQGGGSVTNISHYEYSLDEGATWHVYDPNDKPIAYKDGWVYARTVSVNKVISPYSKEYITLY